MAQISSKIGEFGLAWKYFCRPDRLTLTSPACPAGPQIVSQSKKALEGVEGVAEANIKLVLSPPWTPDRMTDEARDQLGIF